MSYYHNDVINQFIYCGEELFPYLFRQRTMVGLSAHCHLRPDFDLVTMSTTGSEFLSTQFLLQVSDMVFFASLSFL